MSRSYKKHPVCTDHHDKWRKKLANKLVRRQSELYQNNSYKKLYDSWDICDYKFYTSFTEYWTICLRNWERFGKSYGLSQPNKQYEYRQWLKWYKSK
jgi:hypothetical protein